MNRAKRRENGVEEFCEPELSSTNTIMMKCRNNHG